MSKFDQLSRKEFEASRAILEGHFTANTVRLAELVLVDGMTHTQAAAATGVSRQNVGKTIERVCAQISGVPSNWVRVDNVWAPPDVAVEFREKVRLAKEKTPR